MKRVALLISLLALCAIVAAGQTKHLKMRIAVAPLDWSNHDYVSDWQVPVEFRNAIYEKLTKKLLDTGKFVVLEREALEAIQNEKGIKEETSGQNQRGKITPAQSLVQGKVTDFSLASKGGGGGISIGGISVGGRVSEAKVGLNVRIFDVDTSELLASEDAARSVQSHSFSIAGGLNSVFGSFDAFERSPLGEATSKALDECVEKIVKVLDKQGWSTKVADWDSQSKEITIGTGSEGGVQAGDAFDVFRVTKVIKDPETGEILGKKVTKVGSIKVTTVDKRFAVAIPIDGTDFQTGDIVKEQR